MYQYDRTRNACPRDGSNEDWAVVAPYSTLMDETARSGTTPAQRLQRAVLSSVHGCAVVHAAHRPAAVTCCLPTDAVLADGGRG